MAYYSQEPILVSPISQVTATPGSKDPQLGARINFAGNEYVYVYNDGTTQITVGKCAVAAAGTSSYSCTVSSTAANDLPIGVVKHATLTTNTYGWLLTRGYGTAYVSAAAAAGTALEIGADGILQTHLTGVCVAKTLAAASAATGITCTAYFRF